MSRAPFRANFSDIKALIACLLAHGSACTIHAQDDPNMRTILLSYLVEGIQNYHSNTRLSTFEGHVPEVSSMRWLRNQISVVDVEQYVMLYTVVGVRKRGISWSSNCKTSEKRILSERAAYVHNQSFSPKEAI